MRPDEHKKKKNAAYKKKHGIKDSGSHAGDSSGSGKSKDPTKSSKPADGKQKDKNVSDSVSSTKLKGAAVVVDSESESSGSENEKIVKKKNATYRRREIVSNWKKYEMDPTEAEMAAERSKGEKYEKLLSMAGEAIARFRFKDELEWEEGSSEKEGVQTSALNPVELGQSLKCLPLHQVLGLDPHIFTVDQLTTFQSSASAQRNDFNPGTNPDANVNQPSTTPSISSTPDSPSLTQSPQSLTKGRTKKMQTSESGAFSNSDSSLSASHFISADVSREAAQISNKEEQSVSTIKRDGLNTNDLTSRNNDVNTTQLSLNDEDLDALLDMDSPSTASLQPCEDSSFPPPAEEKKIIAGNPVTETQQSCNGAADLEDWLDSVLDS